MVDQKKSGILGMLNRIDARHIHVMVVVVAIIPFLFPLNLPVPVTQQTRLTYNTIAGLKAGDAVMINHDLAPHNT